MHAYCFVSHFINIVHIFFSSLIPDVDDGCEEYPYPKETSFNEKKETIIKRSSACFDLSDLNDKGPR